MIHTHDENPASFVFHIIFPLFGFFYLHLTIYIAINNPNIVIAASNAGVPATVVDVGVAAFAGVVISSIGIIQMLPSGSEVNAIFFPSGLHIG